jgi:uncharacterized RDD family membrane protein YckC
MSYAMQQITLPDPVSQPEFFSGVPFKRFVAWMIDLAVISIVAAIIATLPFFLGWFIIGFIFLAVQLVYCIGSISRHSATPGMRLMNIELRGREGHPLEGGEAALHTITFLISMMFVVPQIITLALILISPRGQGLHDMLLGAVVINKPSKY